MNATGITLSAIRECTMCHNMYPLDTAHFYRVGKHGQGYTTACIPCLRERQRTYIAQVRSGRRAPKHRAPAATGIAASGAPGCSLAAAQLAQAASPSLHSGELPSQPCASLARHARSRQTRTVASKTCKKCGTRHRADHFYANTLTRDGLHSWCKDCCTHRQQQSRLMGHKKNVLAKLGDRRYLQETEARLLAMTREERIRHWRSDDMVVER